MDSLTTTFTDFANRRWTIDLHALLIDQVRRELKVDLLDPQHYMTELSDPCTLVAVLYLLLAEQIEEQGVSEVDFARGLQGQTLLDATLCLWEALAEFLPPAKAAYVRRFIATLLEADALGTQAVDGMFAELDRQMAQMRDGADADAGGD